MSSKHDTTASSKAENRAPDGTTVVPDGSADVRSGDRRLGRRTFLKGIGASAAGAAALGSDYGLTREAEAIAPLIAVGAIGASATLGWAIREFEVVGTDPPAEGTTPDVLKQNVYEQSLNRQKRNKSSVLQSENLVEMGLTNTLYIEGKIAAIEALNAGKSLSEVQAAASDAMDDQAMVVQKNILKTWNASVAHIDSLNSRLVSHSDTATESVYRAIKIGVSSAVDLDFSNTNTVTLADGSTFDVDQLQFAMPKRGGAGMTYGPTTKTYIGDSNPDEDYMVIGQFVADNEPDYLPEEHPSIMDYGLWNGIWSKLSTAITNVSDGLQNWSSSVYDSVQSGSIEISDLLTPRERAAMMAEEEGAAQAIADLAALNIPVDVEREATITFTESGATLRGTFGLTDESDGPIEAGETYDPATFSGDVYFTTDTSLLEGDWSAYESGVDGGNITLTSEPYEGTAVEVTTAADETVTVNATDWTATGSGTWYYDAADDLETTITSVSDARYRANTTETNMETLNLEAEFTVDKFVNQETGEEADSASFESAEPQTDSNYVSQEEWDNLEQQNKELIEKYEASQNNGGGLSLGQFDMFGIPGELVAAGAAALVGWGVLSN